MGKHICIITTIGFSEGEEMYESAVKSAVSSQFRTGIIEVSTSLNVENSNKTV